jgi:uncharacterized protein YkwD
VTRLGALIATVAPIAVWAAIGGSAGAATAHDAPASHGAVAQAVAARSTTHTHTLASHGRRNASACRTTRAGSRAKHGVTCRTTTRHTTTSRSASHAPPPPRKTPAAGAGEAATAHAGAIARVLATPCQNTQLIPEAANLALARAAVLCLVNTARAQNGLEPLGTDPSLERAAESHGKEMLSLDYFDHVSPSGLTPVQRVRTTGYIPNSEVGYVVGENLAWGTLTLATPQAIVSAWIASPEHLANILESKYRDTGIDVEPEVPAKLAEGVAGALYTQEFGVIVH